MKGKFSISLLSLAAIIGLLAMASDVSAQRRRTARRYPPVSNTSFVNVRFNQIADEYLKGYYGFNPSAATAAGLHEYDPRLEARDPESIAREVRRLRNVIALLAWINPGALSAESRYDYLVLLSHARGQLLELQDIRMWQRDPNVYNRTASAGVDNILKRNYAPIDQRLISVVAREREVPRLLADARANLENSPRIYVETAISQVRGSVDYFKRVVPQMIERAGGQRLSAARKAEFETANNGVIATLQSFNEWLERDLLPRSAGAFAIGSENYRRKLLYDEMVDTPISQLISDGEWELRRTQEEMRMLAQEIAPGQGIKAALTLIGTEHGSADGLVGDTRSELDRIRAFVRTQKILTPPASENLTVAETPVYARSTSFASMDSPGAFERTATEAYYYVTPPDPQWDAPKKEQHLSFYNRYSLPIISMHEVFPGHYYQFLTLKRQSSRVRTALGSASFVEGWAHYCEQMMLDEGFGGKNPRLRLAQLSLGLLRLCRYLVGLRLHTQGMTYDQGVEFFIREGYQERVNAEREARRGTIDPTYLVYTMGKMQIMKLREEYKQRVGSSFSIGEFHDRLLSFGMPPVKIIRLAMLGDASGSNLNVASSVGQRQDIEFSVLATGYNSLYQGGRAVQLITNENDWESAWRVIGRGSSGPMPAVNFNTQAVVIVYQGLKNSGGYGVSVSQIRREGMSLLIRSTEQRPKPGDMTTAALTSPFVAVAIPKPPEGTIAKLDDEVNKIEQNRNVIERQYPPRGRYGRVLRRRG